MVKPHLKHYRNAERSEGSRLLILVTEYKTLVFEV